MRLTWVRALRGVTNLSDYQSLSLLDMTKALFFHNDSGVKVYDDAKVLMHNSHDQDSQLQV